MANKPDTDEEMAALRVSGVVVPHNSTIALAPYDPTWPAQFEAEAVKIRRALGERARVLEHAGSTSIPGLCAKPILDIILGVDNSADEDSYVPALTAEGYRLHLREPDDDEHRLLKGDAPNVNMHVYTVGSNEITRMLAFRDRLRAHPEELALYESTKRELAARVWRHVQNYANAKSDVVEAIVARALAERGEK